MILMPNITSSHSYPLGGKNKRVKTHTCAYCKKEFTKHAQEIIYKDGKYVFCTYQCRADWRKHDN